MTRTKWHSCHLSPADEYNFRISILRFILFARKEMVRSMKKNGLQSDGQLSLKIILNILSGMDVRPVVFFCQKFRACLSGKN